MTPLQLLIILRDLGVVVTPTCPAPAVPPGEQARIERPLTFGLHIDAPEGVLTPALREALRTHKDALRDLVEAFEERAAIAEHCGGLPREAAERHAWEFLTMPERGAEEEAEVVHAET